MLIVAAFTGPVAYAGAEPGLDVLHQHTPDPQTHPERQAGSFVVAGAVAHRLRLDVADLRGLPSRTVEVTFKSGSGVEHHIYVGPSLFDVLAKAGPRFDPAIKNDKLRYVVSVSASDGYRALVAYGEIAPGFEGQGRTARDQRGRPVARGGRSTAGRAGRHQRRTIRHQCHTGVARQAGALLAATRQRGPARSDRIPV